MGGAANPFNFYSVSFLTRHTAAEGERANELTLTDVLDFSLSRSRLDCICIFQPFTSPRSHQPLKGCKIRPSFTSISEIVAVWVNAASDCFRHYINIFSSVCHLHPALIFSTSLIQSSFSLQSLELPPQFHPLPLLPSSSVAQSLLGERSGAIM